MAAVNVYGATPRGSVYGLSDIVLEFDAGGTFAAGDFVKFQGTTVGTGGQIVIAAGGDTITVGVALEAGVDNRAGIQVNVTPGLVVTMQNDNDTNTFDATYVGQYADFTGTTGIQRVDTSTHTTTTKANLLCLEYAPKMTHFDNDATTRVTLGNYLLVERAFVA